MRVRRRVWRASADAADFILGLEEVRTLPPPAIQQTVKDVQLYQEVGGLLGRVLLAMLAVRIISRRPLLWMFQGPGLFVVPIVFYFAATGSLDWAKWGIFFAGLFTIAQMSFWGNYMPRVYPTHLRGTGESFAANIGGRMIGTFAAGVTPQLALVVSGATPAHRLALAAATVALVVYVAGFLTSFCLKAAGAAKGPRTNARRAPVSCLSVLRWLPLRRLQTGRRSRAKPSKTLQSYLRIDTSVPPGDVKPAADLLIAILEREGIAVRRFESGPGRSIVHGAAQGLRQRETDPPPSSHGRRARGREPLEARSVRRRRSPTATIWGRGAMDMKGPGRRAALRRSSR